MARRSMRDIMSLVAKGRSNEEIGKALGVSSATIEKDLCLIYGTLDCKAKAAHNKRAEAVARAFEVGVLN